MLRLHARRWSNGAAVAWLMLTTLAALFPGMAHAGCDHPWIDRTAPIGSPTDLSILAPARSVLTPDPGLPDEPRHRSPCMGGACSRSPDLPMTSSGSAKDRIELWG